MRMKAISRLKRELLALHRDEKGADMIEYVLIIAAVALPVLGIIVWFWQDIQEWFKGGYEDLKSDVDGADPSD